MCEQNPRMRENRSTPVTDTDSGTEGDVDDTAMPMDAHRLPKGHGSLELGVPSGQPGTLYALSLTGGIAIGPREGRTILFGRNLPDVHVCVGEDDRKVSRQHGALSYRAGAWWLRNTGHLLLHLPGPFRLSNGDREVPLSEGYTPVVIRGTGDREHLLELYVTGVAGSRPSPRHRDVTQPPRRWQLDDDERLAVAVLGQRYLLGDRYPQPLTWRATASRLSELRPDAGWTTKKVEHKVSDLRTRLSRAGVPGLTEDEVGQPVGNALNDNLIKELLLSTTLGPADVDLLGED